MSKATMRNTNHPHWSCNAASWLIIIGLALGVSWVAVAQKATVTKKKKPILQGICGTVTELKGNQMPRITEDGKAPGSSAGHPVVREVVIYPVFNMAQADMTDEGFVKAVHGLQPVKTAKTDKQGKFCVYGLPAGQYSVLVQESKGLYAHVFDGKNNLNPVLVKKNHVSKAEIAITHQAAF